MSRSSQEEDLEAEGQATAMTRPKKHNEQKAYTSLCETALFKRERNQERLPATVKRTEGKLLFCWSPLHSSFDLRSRYIFYTVVSRGTIITMINVKASFKIPNGNVAFFAYLDASWCTVDACACWSRSKLSG